jgi:hypothetical protein
MNMKIQVNTTAKAVESVNCILGQAINQLMERGDIAKALGLTAKDVVLAEQFRQRLLKSYLK